MSARCEKPVGFECLRFALGGKGTHARQRTAMRRCLRIRVPGRACRGWLRSWVPFAWGSRDGELAQNRSKRKEKSCRGTGQSSQCAYRLRAVGCQDRFPPMDLRAPIHQMKTELALPGVGIDVVEVSRIERIWQRHGDRFLDRVFTPAETEYCLAMPGPSRHLAARFAAKEAASKSLGTGVGGGVEWTDLEVIRHDSGVPELCLHRVAARRADEMGIGALRVSLSHSETLAAAAVMAVGLADAREPLEVSAADADSLPLADTA